MTNFNNIKFDGKDVIKLVGFMGFCAMMWYDLKTDLQVFKATTELRLQALEQSTAYPHKEVTYKPRREAVMPSEIKIETE